MGNQSVTTVETIEVNKEWVSSTFVLRNKNPGDGPSCLGRYPTLNSLGTRLETAVNDLELAEADRGESLT